VTLKRLPDTARGKDSKDRKKRGMENEKIRHPELTGIIRMRLGVATHKLSWPVRGRGYLRDAQALVAQRKAGGRNAIYGGIGKET